MKLPGPRLPCLLAAAALWLRLGAWTGFAASPDDNWDPAIGIPGSDGPVGSLLVVGDTVYAAGSFSQIGGVVANSIAKFDTNGWAALGEGITVGILPTVLALAYLDGQIYAGGAFGQAGSTQVNNIARWDGTNWFPCGQGIGGSGIGIVRAMAIAGGKLIVGGSFDVAGGKNALNTAIWDTTNWAPIGSGVPGTAVDSVAASGTTIYAGGRFRLGEGVNATNIAMWNGTSWSALAEGIRDFDQGGGGGGKVRALSFLGSDLIAAGSFRLAGATRAANVARWNGTQWSPLGTGIDIPGDVWALGVSGGEMYAAGFFSSAGGTSTLAVAKWDGTVWSPLGSGATVSGRVGSGRTLAVTGSELYLGGFLDEAGGKSANNLALWHIPHSLDIRRGGDVVALSWPATGTNFLLEACGDLGQGNWQEVTSTPVIINDQCVVTNALGPGHQFYRLRRK